MLYAKYGITRKRDIAQNNVNDLLKDFESKGHVPTGNFLNLN